MNSILKKEKTPDSEKSDESEREEKKNLINKKKEKEIDANKYNILNIFFDSFSQNTYKKSKEIKNNFSEINKEYLINLAYKRSMEI